jgi:hypothetical protein
MLLETLVLSWWIRIRHADKNTAFFHSKKLNFCNCKPILEFCYHLGGDDDPMVRAEAEPCGVPFTLSTKMDSDQQSKKYLKALRCGIYITFVESYSCGFTALIIYCS